MFCHEDTDEPIQHLKDCVQAPEEARGEAQKVWDSRVAYCAVQVCCKLRKKILLKPVKLSKELCGIDDSELLDVMTFNKAHDKNEIQFRFCPWCGIPWIVTGISVV